MFCRWSPLGVNSLLSKSSPHLSTTLETDSPFNAAFILKRHLVDLEFFISRVTETACLLSHGLRSNICCPSDNYLVIRLKSELDFQGREIY